MPVIEHGIPIPLAARRQAAKRLAGVAQTLHEMRKGDSVLLLTRDVNKWFRASYDANVTVVTRRVDDTHHRLWRT